MTDVVVCIVGCTDFIVNSLLMDQLVCPGLHIKDIIYYLEWQCVILRIPLRIMLNLTF